MIADTQYGPVAGTSTADGVRSFLGIPYAAPPVDALRWRMAEPPQRWSEPLCADRFGPACFQAALPADAILRQSMKTGGAMIVSEDCLYLNVWAPADARDAPVLVWVHGGGNRFGSGAALATRGEALARRGIVTVTFNYRLGALGFLAHPELTQEAGTSGNYGLGDTIAVLRWVAANIAAFGGDPARVTLAGHSVGAAQVLALMTNPEAKGLFGQAICQSPMAAFSGATKMPDREQAEAGGVKLAESHKATSLEQLRGLPAFDLARETGFGPIVDGRIITDRPDAIFAAGRQARIPLLVGSTSDEGTPYPQAPTKAAFEERAVAAYGERAEDFLSLYPVSDDSEASAAGQRAFRDSVVAWQAWTAARQQLAAGENVYAYSFQRTPPHAPGQRFRELGDASRYGPFHGAEVPFVFDTLDLLYGPTDEDSRAMAASMASYWASFVESGNPNRPGLPAWPVMRDADGPVLSLGQGASHAIWPEQQALRFFDDVYLPSTERQAIKA